MAHILGITGDTYRGMPPILDGSPPSNGTFTDIFPQDICALSPDAIYELQVSTSPTFASLVFQMPSGSSTYTPAAALLVGLDNNSTLVGGSPLAVTFDWSDVAGAQYNLQVSPVPEFTTLAINQWLAASEFAASLSYGTSYWRVFTATSTLDASPSVTWSLHVAPITPPPPALPAQRLGHEHFCGVIRLDGRGGRDGLHDPDRVRAGLLRRSVGDGQLLGLHLLHPGHSAFALGIDSLTSLAIWGTAESPASLDATGIPTPAPGSSKHPDGLPGFSPKLAGPFCEMLDGDSFARGGR